MATLVIVIVVIVIIVIMMIICNSYNDNNNNNNKNNNNNNNNNNNCENKIINEIKMILHCQVTICYTELSFLLFWQFKTKDCGIHN